ncbi:MAG: hypothetical protein IH899_15505, partial [Planctomycetes bacterium]|nr:hypothetical protein [Planctomycetota bacterium]
MGYEALVRKSWQSGDFVISEMEAGAKDEAEDDKALAWRRARREMEEIIGREAADVNCCLSAHREGIMKLAPFV